MQGHGESPNELSNLSEIVIGEKFSGFGVVLDATRAIRVNSRQSVEYSTQIKLIDKTTNPSLASRGYVTFFIFWTNEENQPFPFRIGDILRFNNFEFERFRGYLQGKNRKGASWCIFHGDSPNNDPYCQSVDYKEKMTQFLVQSLHEHRQWATAFFQTNSLKNLDWYSYERHLDNPSVLQTFDMLLRVEEIRLGPEQSSGLLLILLDNKMTRFQTHISAIHGRFLKEGDIVKLRSIEAAEGDYLRGHSRYFAVLGIPTTFRDAREFNEAIQIHETQESRRVVDNGNLGDDGDIEQVPRQFAGFDASFFSGRGPLLQGGSMLSSAVSNRSKGIPKSTGLEVLKILESQEFDRLIKGENKYHMRLTLIDIRPKSLMQSLRNECKTCRLIRKLDAPEGEVCCSKRMEKTMLLRLLWQDQSLKNLKKLLITYVAPGDDNFVKCIFPDFPLGEIGSGDLEKYEKTWEEIIEKNLEDDRLFDILAEPFDNISLKENDGQVPLRLAETLFLPVLQGWRD